MIAIVIFAFMLLMMAVSSSGLLGYYIYHRRKTQVVAGAVAPGVVPGLLPVVPGLLPNLLLSESCPTTTGGNFSATLGDDVKQIPYSQLPEGEGHIFPDCLVSVVPSQSGKYVAIWAESFNYRSESTSAKLENHTAKAPRIYGYPFCEGAASADYVEWGTGGLWLMWVRPIAGTSKWLAYVHTEEGVDTSGKCVGGGNTAHKRIGVAYSSDEGKSWTKAQKMIDIGKITPNKFTGAGDCGGLYVCGSKTWYCYFGGDHMLGIGRSKDGEAKPGSWQVLNNGQWVDALTATEYSPMNITPVEYRNMANVNCHFNTELGQYVMIGSPYSAKQDIVISASQDGETWSVFKKISMSAPLQMPIPKNPFYPFVIGDKSHYEAGKTATMYYATWDYTGPYARRTMNYRTITFSK